VIDPTSLIWLRLRERRGSIHERSELMKDSSSRRKTFAAAMQQFEEQMTAAKVVTPATSPSNLYYALAQAGLAIVAAYAPEPWTPRSSHGVKLVDTEPDLADILVRTDGHGLFQAVASVTGSPGISRPVSIGSLWASLPDTNENAPLPSTDHPGALYAIPDMGSPMTVAIYGQLDRTLYIGPAAVLIHIKTEMPDDADREPWLRNLLERYPALIAWKADPSGWEGYERAGMPETSIRMWLPQDTSEARSEEEMNAIFDKIAPQYRYNTDRYIRPSIEGEPAPSPLMTWWLLLYSFSILARYQPRKWTDLLNLDKPGCATELEYALQTALSAIPQLVLEALDRRALLLPKPMSF
jgi:hypothetical protein